MNRSLLLALAVLTASGCIINGRGSQNQPGDIDLYWTILNGRCADHPEVAKVVVTIPGETLENSGTYACNNGGVDGIRLKNFAGKTYSVTVDAFNAQNERIYTGIENVTVNGNASASFDLVPPGAKASYARLFWTLPNMAGTGTQTCAQAGMTKALVYIDNAITPEQYTCAQGETVSGAQTPFIDPGTHSIRVDIADASGYVYMSKTSTLVTYANNPVDSSFTTVWVVGGTKLHWELATKTNAAITCANAKVVDVYVNFQNAATNAWFYADSNGNATTGDKQPCDFVAYYNDALPPGTWKVFVQGWSTDSTPVVYDNFAAPETVSVTAGVFMTDTSVAKQIILKEQ